MITARATVDMSPAEGMAKAGIKKATRIGLNRASAPVKAAVVSEAEAIRRFGFLAKSIRIRVRNYGPDRWVSIVGPGLKFTRTRGKRKRGKNKGQPIRHTPANVAHLVEKGTKHSKGRGFLKKAHAGTGKRFTVQAAAEVGKEIEAELARRQG